MGIFDKMNEFDFSDNEMLKFLRDVFHDAENYKKWQKECPWEIRQWDSIDFGWKKEMFYKN